MIEFQKNLLFVDEDQEFLDSIQRAITAENFPWKVFTVNSAKDALDMEGIGAADVIFTNLLMSQPDGIWFIEQLQQNPLLKHIPIIVLTGIEDDQLKHKAMELGALYILNKPVHLDDLFAHIKNAVRVKEYQDDIARRNKVLEKEIIRRTRQLELSRIEIIWKLARAGEIRDEQTENHVIRVGYYSQILARGLKLPDEEVYLIFLTSPLHDIGKIAIPEYVLRKPLPLSPDEMNIIRSHTIYGSQLLLERSKHEIMIMDKYLEGKKEFVQTGILANPFLEKAAEIALTHHESWDGSGYPYGKKMEEIPLSGELWL